MERRVSNQRPIVGTQRLSRANAAEVVVATAVTTMGSPSLSDDEKYWIDHWTTIAQQSHYPRCCTVYFLSEGRKITYHSDWPAEVRLAATLLHKHNYNFIPCPDCSHLITTNLNHYLQEHLSLIPDEQRSVPNIQLINESS